MERESQRCSSMDSGEIMDFAALDPEIQELIKASVKSREYSYSPYSNFKVGAAILCEDGFVITGCNVENASYPVTICAERTAIAKAISEGKNKFKALSVVADHESTEFTTPCGLCRQTIVEFGHANIYLSRSNMNRVMITTAKQLLPDAYAFNT